MNESIIDDELVKFPRRNRRGIVLGRSLLQCVVIGAGLVCFGVSVSLNENFGQGVLLGILMAAPLCAIGAWNVGDFSLLAMIGKAFGFGINDTKGQNDFRYNPMEKTVARRRADERVAKETRREKREAKRNEWTPDKPVRMMLPGEAQELLVYTMKSGTALIYDPVKNTIAVSARVVSDGFTHKDIEDQMLYVHSWSQILVNSAGHEGMERIVTIDRTVVHPSGDMLEYYQGEVQKTNAGPRINAEADRQFRELIDKAGTHTRHEMFITVVMSTNKLRKQVRELGGGMRSYMTLVENEMKNIEDDLPLAGAQVDEWLSPRQLGAVIREAFDPDSIQEISERKGDRAGVAVSSAGPVGASRRWNFMQSDSALHKTYYVSEWPRVQVGPGFLKSLTFAGDFVHTVTLIAEPEDTGSALKEVQKEMGDIRTARRINQKLDRVETLDEATQHSDVEDLESELVQGHGRVRFVGLITISAADKQGLAAAHAKLKAGASQSRIEIRLLAGQQYQGFLAGALPLGRGFKKPFKWLRA